MLFNSLEFYLFFPLITLLYFIFPHRFRWQLLLAASCIFYMGFIPIYIAILFFTIIIDYYAGIYIEKSEKRNKKLLLIISLISNIGILAIFKYYNFFVSNFDYLFSLVSIKINIPLLSIALPVGLSFHTFQAMSYTIEVYRGNQKAERNFGIYALYVMFYPQLVAGPIERPQNIIHQFYEKKTADYVQISDGLKLMLYGFFKKVVIADTLAIYVDSVYDSPAGKGGIECILATVFFAFQIFCDFSGYSDIALGSAKVMGFKLMKNFDRPYFSLSISEFWRRWHISLSSWFKDYVYIPLGGNKVGKFQSYFNLLFIFLLSGLWHGANWTFIIWGGFHGAYLIFALVTQESRKKIALFIFRNENSLLYIYGQRFTVFFLVCLAWVFFRATSIHDAFSIFSSAFGWFKQLFFYLSELNFHLILHSLGMSEIFKPQVLICFAFIVLLEFTHSKTRTREIYEYINSLPHFSRWFVYLVGMYMILHFGKAGVVETKFIYFQF